MAEFQWEKLALLINVMKILELYYSLRGKPVPYYAKYSLWAICMRPIRKFLNVVIIPNIPFTSLRVSAYRMLGYNIGKRVFIGMKCYLDDTEPSHTVIEDDVIISYGCYFAIHGRNQKRTFIRLKQGAYVGMRATFVSGRQGLTVGENAVIGACALVNKDIPDRAVAVGMPAKVVRFVEEGELHPNDGSRSPHLNEDEKLEVFTPFVHATASSSKEGNG